VEPDAFNHSLRKFLKRVGVSSQREIEQALQAALRQAKLAGSDVRSTGSSA